MRSLSSPSIHQGEKEFFERLRIIYLVAVVQAATNASSERSFSALRRVKSYLQTAMTQERLNYLMLLHVHKERTDSLDLKLLVNDFICSDHRSNMFAKF